MKKVARYFESIDEAIKAGKSRARTNYATHYIYAAEPGGLYYIRGVVEEGAQLAAKVFYDGSVELLQPPGSPSRARLYIDQALVAKACADAHLDFLLYKDNKRPVPESLKEMVERGPARPVLRNNPQWHVGRQLARLIEKSVYAAHPDFPFQVNSEQESLYTQAYLATWEGLAAHAQSYAQGAQGQARDQERDQEQAREGGSVL